MADYRALPFFEDLAQGWRYRTDIVDWPMHYTRAIEKMAMGWFNRLGLSRAGASS